MSSKVHRPLSLTLISDNRHYNRRQWLRANLSCTNAHFWLFLCGIRFMVRVRLKVLLTRLDVLHAFVREWLVS